MNCFLFLYKYLLFTFVTTSENVVTEAYLFNVVEWFGLFHELLDSGP